ncbi:MAG TPA: DUF1328 domain-containing protein [Chondromyces sp.]|nr:DUF1328 domain-containing protein [Chondromyces sp.]
MGWALVFFLIATVAAGFGFFGLDGTATSIVKALFVVFLIPFVVSLIMGRRPRV